MKRTISFACLFLSILVYGCKPNPVKNIEGNYQNLDSASGNVTLKLTKMDEGYSYLLLTNLRKISGTVDLIIPDDKDTLPKVVLNGIIWDVYPNSAADDEKLNVVAFDVNKDGSLRFNNQNEDYHILKEIRMSQVSLQKTTEEIDFETLEKEIDRKSKLVIKNNGFITSESIQNIREAYSEGLIGKFDELIIPAPRFTNVVEKKIGIYTVFGLESNANYNVYILGNPSFAPLMGFKDLTTTLMGGDGAILRMMVLQGVQQNFVKPGNELGKFVILSIIPNKYEDVSYFVMTGYGFSSVENAAKRIGKNKTLNDLKTSDGLDMDTI
jgi:hypothetical protein